MTSRPVYLPAGTRGRDAWPGSAHDGAQTVEAVAPLDRIPLYIRDGADLPIHDRLQSICAPNFEIRGR